LIKYDRLLACRGSVAYIVTKRRQANSLSYLNQSFLYILIYRHLQELSHRAVLMLIIADDSLQGWKVLKR